MASPPPPGGFSLFPNTSASPPRRTTPRPSTGTSPVDGHPRLVVVPGPYANITPGSPPRQATQSPLNRVGSPMSRSMGPPPQVPDRIESASPAVQQPRTFADNPPRSETAFSQAQTLVRSGSTRSRSSIAKRPLEDGYHTQEEPVMRSIFPRYNPDVSLNQQEYYPTQASPTHIPRAVISRPMYSPEPVTPLSPPPPIDAVMHQHHRTAQPAQWGPVAPPQPTGPPPLPEVSTTEDLKSLWRVANGWKASHSEGQVYCMKMTMDKDAPMYTLSSTTQPFYYFRVNPTSASAIVTLSRHDPAKICKGPPSSGSTTRSGSTRSSILSIPLSPKFADKHWQEVLSTSLEASSRRHRPNDGLVAHLAPTQAVKIMADKPEDEGAAYLAELECARLVWDDDSSSHFLVHPALATPFCVTVERCDAWSRVEYTLEHHESPNHLARLTRDGTGVGYLEVDTALASKIESYFLIDVAVAALLTVAASDARAAAAETFEPPPTPPDMAHLATPRSDRFSLVTNAISKKLTKKAPTHEFEIYDVESQEDYGSKMKKAKKLKAKKPKRDGSRFRDKLPWPARILVTIGLGFGKCLLWVVTCVLKVVVWFVSGVLKALGLVGTTK